MPARDLRKVIYLLTAICCPDITHVQRVLLENGAGIANLTVNASLGRPNLALLATGCGFTFFSHFSTIDNAA
jgi:hypothetical protein